MDGNWINVSDKSTMKQQNMMNLKPECEKKQEKMKMKEGNRINDWRRNV